MSNRTVLGILEVWCSWRNYCSK